MGYMRRHTIVVADHGYGDFLESAHKKAQEIFPWVSPISPPQMNSERAFFIPPDGSKEGWPESDEGDRQRGSFLEYLETLLYEDNSSPLSWVEILFGDDEGILRIERSDSRKRKMNRESARQLAEKREKQ